MRARAPRVAAAVAVACAVLLLALPETLWPLRLPATLLLLAWLPGYATIAALHPNPMLGPVERGTLATGLSLSLTILIALAADALSVPLSEPLWAIAPATLTVIAAMAAGPGPMPRGLQLRRPSTRPADVGYALLIAGLLAAAAWIGTAPRPLPEDVPGTASLWILPAGADRVRIGVQNQERGERSYTVSVTQRGSRRVLRTPRLRPGQAWTTTVRAPASRGRVEAALTRSAPALSRRVNLTPRTADRARGSGER